MKIYLLLNLLLLLAEGGPTIKIVSTHDEELRLEPCAVICSGVEPGDSGWRDSSNEAGRVIDYSKCGFVSGSKPTLTLTVQGGRCPSVYVYDGSATSNTASVYTVEDIKASTLMSENCSINWSATGFSCN